MAIVGMWLVLVALRQVEVYRPGEDVKTYTLEDVLNGGDVLPGFELAVRDIFDV